MHNPKITPRFERRSLSRIVSCAILASLTAACNAPRELSGAQLAAGVAGYAGSLPAATGSPARATQITKQLSPACPTPTQWTAAQGQVVGNYMLSQAREPGMMLLAPEWERLNDGALICRGKKPGGK